MRVIKACAGIGDSVWLAMKLINQPEKFNWKLPDGHPQRGKQLFDLLPQITESCEYAPGMGYKMIKRSGYKGQWKSSPPKEMFLEANTHLEFGKRIEKFLPDLETSFILPYKTTDDDHNSAINILGVGNEKYIGIYTSAYSNARRWGGWQAHEWVSLITMIKEYSVGYRFVFIGAEYDIGVSQEVMSKMDPDDYVNTIGQPLPVVIEILKRLDCFIGFPSGLSIINETLGARQTVMFYPPHLKMMQNAWADPARIESGRYKGCQFCEPKVIFDWLVSNEKL